MNSLSDIIRRLLDPGVIAVVRARSEEQVPPLAEALIEGGVTAVEITMTTPNALEAIRRLAPQVGDRGLVGVGSVLNTETCAAALEAGAQFVVSPIAKVELVELCHRAARPVMLGAYTPTEAQTVHESGADFVKLFPADSLGPAYIKAIRAPLPHLRIVPTGGVVLQNIGEFFESGCAAVGVGSSLISRAILEQANWKELARLSREFAQVARQARSAS